MQSFLKVACTTLLDYVDDQNILGLESDFLHTKERWNIGLSGPILLAKQKATDFHSD